MSIVLILFFIFLFLLLFVWYQTARTANYLKKQIEISSEIKALLEKIHRSLNVKVINNE